MIKFILLGIVQGITEFIPVSSSGHLVILQHIFEIKENVVFLDLILHMGTLCSLIVFFRRDILILLSNFFMALNDIIFNKKISYVLGYNDNFKLCINILVSCLVTGFIYLKGNDFFDRQFTNINTVILCIFITGIILLLTKNFVHGQRRLRHILLRDSILFGLVQSFALLPGISRAGITISMLLFSNLDRESAFKFSFLASIPIISVAFFSKLIQGQGISRDIPLIYLFSGFLFAFISGLAALHFLRFILKKNSFFKFSYYCFFISILVLILRLRQIL